MSVSQVIVLWGADGCDRRQGSGRVAKGMCCAVRELGPNPGSTALCLCDLGEEALTVTVLSNKMGIIIIYLTG